GQGTWPAGTVPPAARLDRSGKCGLVWLLAICCGLARTTEIAKRKSRGEFGGIRLLRHQSELPGKKPSTIAGNYSWTLGSLRKRSSLSAGRHLGRRCFFDSQTDRGICHGHSS